MLSQQQLAVYQETLKQKYEPIFQQMDDIMLRKKMEYLDHLVRHLEQNHQRILLERETLGKMEKSFNQLKPSFKDVLEKQMSNIKKNVERQEKIYKEAQEKIEKQ